MIYYMIRHKATGEFMPELRRTRGYSHWNPSRVPTELLFRRNKLLGVPRLFPSRQSASRSITQWNALPNGFNNYSRPNSWMGDDDDAYVDFKADGRSKNDLEIVEVNIEIQES